MGQTNKSGIVVLTGAGSSVHIGIPTMAEMVVRYRADRSNSTSTGRALSILDQLGVSKDLEEMLLGIQQIAEYADTPVYRLLDGCDNSRN